MTTTLTEADIEEAALAWLGEFCWGLAHGPGIAPNGPSVGRDALLPRLVSG